MSEAQGQPQGPRIFVVSPGGVDDDTQAIQAALDGVGFFPGLASSIDGPQAHRLFE